MNTNQKLNVMLVLCMLAGMVTTGCQQSAPPSAASHKTNTQVTVDVDGCCGNCATDQSLSGEADGCCGKCVAEPVAAGTQEDGCSNDCNACAEGDSSNCKCEREPSTVDFVGEKQVNTHDQDRDLFHFLLENHGKLTRKVVDLENGVETLTESAEAGLATAIQEHVASMYARVEDGRRIRMWDTLYQEVFRHADKIEMKIENTEHGIRVIETSEDEYVVKLIQAHARVVTGFVENGFEEARKNHEPPNR